MTADTSQEAIAATLDPGLIERLIKASAAYRDAILCNESDRISNTGYDLDDVLAQITGGTK